MPGGQYSPLTQENVARIHQAALQALEEIGLEDEMFDKSGVLPRFLKVFRLPARID